MNIKIKFKLKLWDIERQEKEKREGEDKGGRLIYENYYIFFDFFICIYLFIIIFVIK